MEAPPVPKPENADTADGGATTPGEAVSTDGEKKDTHDDVAVSAGDLGGTSSGKEETSSSSGASESIVQPPASAMSERPEATDDVNSDDIEQSGSTKAEDGAAKQEEAKPAAPTNKVSTEADTQKPGPEQEQKGGEKGNTKPDPDESAANVIKQEEQGDKNGATDLPATTMAEKGTPEDKDHIGKDERGSEEDAGPEARGSSEAATDVRDEAEAKPSEEKDVDKDPEESDAHDDMDDEDFAPLSAPSRRRASSGSKDGNDGVVVPLAPPEEMEYQGAREDVGGDVVPEDNSAAKADKKDVGDDQGDDAEGQPGPEDGEAAAAKKNNDKGDSSAELDDDPKPSSLEQDGTSKPSSSSSPEGKGETVDEPPPPSSSANESTEKKTAVVAEQPAPSSSMSGEVSENDDVDGDVDGDGNGDGDGDADTDVDTKKRGREEVEVLRLDSGSPAIDASALEAIPARELGDAAKAKEEEPKERNSEPVASPLEEATPMDTEDDKAAQPEGDTRAEGETQGGEVTTSESHEAPDAKERRLEKDSGPVPKEDQAPEDPKKVKTEPEQEREQDKQATRESGDMDKEQSSNKKASGSPPEVESDQRTQQVYPGFLSPDEPAAGGDTPGITDEWRAKLRDARSLLRTAFAAEESTGEDRAGSRNDDPQKTSKEALNGEGKRQGRGKTKGKPRDGGSGALGRGRGGAAGSKPHMPAWPGKAKIVRLMPNVDSKEGEAHPSNLWVVLEVEPERGICSVAPLRPAGVFMRGTNAGRTRYKVIPSRNAIKVSITRCDVLASRSVSHASSLVDKTWALLQQLEQAE